VPVPRLDAPELCWLCGKPMLVGHSTRALTRSGFQVHTRCFEEDSRKA
jgi:hypothetical protein